MPTAHSTAATDFRNISLCLGALVLATLLAWPFANLGFGDDVAYSHLALQFHHTGHLLYNGWEAAIMVPQVYWGAFFIKLFGFSFQCLRFSTFPWALGSVALCYWLVRRMGLASPCALFVTLLFAVNPVFLPLATSYMTDVLGLFFLFASLNALIRAAETSGTRRAYIWLTIGLAAGLVGGTSRQAVWFAPLVVLPYLAWAERRRTPFARTCMVAWLVAVVCIAGTSYWFNRQPYIVPMPSLREAFRQALHRPAVEIETLARMLLMLLLLCLPAALPLAARSLSATYKNGRSRQLLLCALLLIVVGCILIHPSLASIPWIFSTLDWQGISGDAPLPGRPVVLTHPIRAAVAIPVYVVACILLAQATRLRSALQRMWKKVWEPANSDVALVSVILFAVVYLAMIVVRAAEFPPFDRYLLPLVPAMAALLLLLTKTEPAKNGVLRRNVLTLSWALLFAFGTYAVLSTYDFWALARARVTAANILEREHVPRTAIDGGMEYNFWTQLLNNDHVNYRFVKNPPSAYQPQFGVTPVVIPEYRLEYAPIPPETEASKFGVVPYFSPLPPFHKRVSIDRMLKPAAGVH